MTSILLLEDNYKLLRLYTKFLTSYGYDVEPIMAVETALDVFSHGKFDLIISDLRVGSYSISRLIKRLKKINVKSNIPILVISAHIEVYEKECHEVGIDELLAKPFGREDLIVKVEQILSQAGSLGLKDAYSNISTSILT